MQSNHFSNIIYNKMCTKFYTAPASFLHCLRLVTAPPRTEFNINSIDISKKQVRNEITLASIKLQATVYVF